VPTSSRRVKFPREILAEPISTPCGFGPSITSSLSQSSHVPAFSPRWKLIEAVISRQKVIATDECPRDPAEKCDSSRVDGFCHGLEPTHVAREAFSKVATNESTGSPGKGVWSVS